jgi:hypothetical protein
MKSLDDVKVKRTTLLAIAVAIAVKMFGNNMSEEDEEAFLEDGIENMMQDISSVIIDCVMDVENGEDPTQAIINNMMKYDLQKVWGKGINDPESLISFLDKLTNGHGVHDCENCDHSEGCEIREEVMKSKADGTYPSSGKSKKVSKAPIFTVGNEKDGPMFGDTRNGAN